MKLSEGGRYAPIRRDDSPNPSFLIGYTVLRSEIILARGAARVEYAQPAHVDRKRNRKPKAKLDHKDYVSRLRANGELWKRKQIENRKGVPDGLEYRRLTIRRNDSPVINGDRSGFTRHCASCRADTRQYRNGVQTIDLVDAPAFGLATRLRVERQVTKCLKCQKYMSEDISDIMATTHAADECQHKMTQRCVDYIAKRAALLPFETVGDELGIAHQTVAKVAVECWRKSERYDFPPPRYLGIDEICLKFPSDKRKRDAAPGADVRGEQVGNKKKKSTKVDKKKDKDYCAVFVDLDTGQVLDMLPKHDYRAVLAWINGLKKAGKHREIRAVSMDFAPQYKKAVTEALPNVATVVDAFHVVHQVRKAYREVWSRTFGRGKKRKPAIEQLNLPGIDRIDELTTADLARQTYHLFRNWWNSALTPLDAYEAFLQWSENLPLRLKHEEKFRNAIKTISSRAEDVFHYHLFAVTNGPTEASNRITRRVHELSSQSMKFETLRLKMRARRVLKPRQIFRCEQCHSQTPSKSKKIHHEMFVARYHITSNDEIWLCEDCSTWCKKQDKEEYVSVHIQRATDGYRYPLKDLHEERMQMRLEMEQLEAETNSGKYDDWNDFKDRAAG
ncbi:MAG: transposase [Beijerinckiaceae bacterium]